MYKTLWTPNTLSNTRHPTKCPLSHLPTLSRLRSSRHLQLCFQHETGSKVLPVCMIHKGWNGDGIIQLMLAPTIICPSAKEDKTHKYQTILRPCFSPVQSPDFPSWPAGSCLTILANHCYRHCIFHFFVPFFSPVEYFCFFLHYKHQGHRHGPMKKGLR